MRRKVVLQANSANECTQSLAAEYDELKSVIVTLEKEEEEMATQLSSIQTAVRECLECDGIERSDSGGVPESDANPCRIDESAA